MFKLFRSTYELLDFADKKKFFFLISLNIIGMFMEIFGLGLLIPIVSIVLKNDLYGMHEKLDLILNFFNSPSQNTLLFISLLLFSFYYIFKSFFSTYLLFKQNSFLSFLKAKISTFIFETYIRRDFSFFLNLKSSVIIRNVRRETDLLLEVIIQAIIVLITEFFIILGILTFLFYFQPLGSIAIIVVIFIVIFFHRLFTKKITYKFGKVRQDNESFCIQIVQQSLSSIITIKLKSFEEIVISNFRQFAEKEADAQRFQATMQEFPRLWLELVSIIGLSFLIIAMQYQNYTTTNTIVVLAIFAGAAFKVLPSLNRAFVSIQKLRYGNPIMHTIKKIFSDYKNETKNIYIKDANKIKEINKIKTDHFLEIKNLSFRYEDKSELVFKDLNLSIKNNEKIGITGNSGSGKSTLVNLILGLLKPKSGEIFFKSNNINNIKKNYYKNLAYIPQNIFLLNDTILNNIIFGMQGDIDYKKLNQILEVLQINTFIKKLPNQLETLIGENSLNISGGQKQRLGLARALYSEPEFLLLDEATNALDKQTETIILNSIFSLRSIKNIVIISHNVNNFNYCNKIFKIKNKQLVEMKNE